MSRWLTRLILLKELNSAQGGTYIIDATDPTGGSGELVEADCPAPAEASTELVNGTDNLFLSTQKICRLCSKPADRSLLEKHGDLDLVSAVRVVTNITISADDQYPKYVCFDCIVELKAAFTFKRKCEDTDMKYRQLVRPEYHPAQPENFRRHDFALRLHQMRAKRAELERIRFENENKRRRKRAKAVRKVSNQYKCVSCEAPFFDKEKLAEHRAQRACASLPCPLCHKSVLNVRLHMHRVHARHVSVRCPVCGRVARTAAYLKSHMRVHSDKCEHACPLCPYRGKHRAYLALHMRKHTGERRYLCALCSASFSDASNFRKHGLVHKAKPFQCPKCKKCFHSSKKLREHDEGFHQRILHPCSICGKTFSYRAFLLRHELRVHHREKITRSGAAAPGAQAQRALGAPLDAYLAFRSPSDAGETAVNDE